MRTDIEPESAATARPTAARVADVLRQTVRSGGRCPLYGVVDGARALMLAYEASAFHEYGIRPLFDGVLADQLGDVAPYLVPIQPHSGYLERWAGRWGDNAGILLVTRAEPDPLWDHLRSLFLAEDEEGQEFFFRFYDPRVLRAYLPTCTAAETEEFFGPIRCIYVEADPPTAVLECAPSAHGVRITPHPLLPLEEEGLGKAGEPGEGQRSS